MKKVIIICFIIFFLGVGLFFLFVLFFGETKVRKIKPIEIVKEYHYEESPFYRETLRNNDSIIYLNIWTSYSPYSVDRYKELVKDKSKIIYNLSLDKDSLSIKKNIEKFGIENDITLKNYKYRDEILKKVYYKWQFSIGDFIEFSDYKTPMTFYFDKNVFKGEFKGLD